jgi:hypothetical protein
MKKTPVVLLACMILLLAGCSKSHTKSADLTQVMADMKQKISNTQMTDLSADDLMPDYGIDSGDVKQFAIYIDSTGTKGDEIILMEGKNSASADRIEKCLNKRYEQKKTEMKSYLPEEYAMLEKCRVRRDGTYVAMIVSPQHEDLEKIYLDALTPRAEKNCLRCLGAAVRIRQKPAP